MERVTLIAEDDMIWTNGEIYGKEIYLAEGASAISFYKITEEEYQKIKSSNEDEE